MERKKLELVEDIDVIPSFQKGWGLDNNVALLGAFRAANSNWNIWEELGS